MKSSAINNLDDLVLDLKTEGSENNGKAPLLEKKGS